MTVYKKELRERERERECKCVGEISRFFKRTKSSENKAFNEKIMRKAVCISWVFAYREKGPSMYFSVVTKSARRRKCQETKSKNRSRLGQPSGRNKIL